MLLLPFSAYSTTTFTAIPCFRYSLLTSQYNTCRERSNEVCTKRDFSPLFFSLEETLTLRAFVAYTFYYNKNWRIEEEELVRREVFKLTIWWIFMFLNQIASILKDSRILFSLHLWNAFIFLMEQFPTNARETSSSIDNAANLATVLQDSSNNGEIFYYTDSNFF